MSDTGRHLTYFKVENFKRFESFEMKDLGQFNLIVGDNNVGKTSVLEALLACRQSWIFQNRLGSILQLKKIKLPLCYGDFEHFYHKKDGKFRTQLWISFKLTTKNESQESITIGFNNVTSNFTFSGEDSKIVSNGYREEVRIDQKLFLPLIPFSVGHDYDLIDFFPTLQRSQSLKASFIKSLSIIIQNLANIDMTLEKNSLTDKISPYLIMNQTHLDYNLPLALFGDGALKLFRILAWIILNQGERLMVDEVEAGIHYSRFKEFWKVILITARDNDVQLFMTTHSKECIQAFVEVLAENDMKVFQKTARNITLQELPDKSVKAFTFPFEELESSVVNGNEVRGGY